MTREDGLGAWAERGHDDTARDAALLRQLARADVGHDEVLVALDAAFEGHPPAERLAALDDAARLLFGAAALDLDGQAERLMETLRTGLGLTRAGDDGELLLHRGLARGVLHPVTMAATAHELARRAGLHSLVAASRPGWWVVLAREQTWIAVGFGPETGPAALARLRGCCAHALADEILGRLAAGGPAPLAGRARRLQAALT